MEVSVLKKIAYFVYFDRNKKILTDSADIDWASL